MNERGYTGGIRSCWRWRAGFSLLELLVVIALVAGLGMVVAVRRGAGDGVVAMRAARAQVENLLVAARWRAMAKGDHARLLVHEDSDAAGGAGRYLRTLALEERSGGGWTTIEVLALPAGIYVVPHQSRWIDGLVVEPARWTRDDGARLHSTCLHRAPVVRRTDRATEEKWAEIVFTPQGTTATSGQLVLARGRVRAEVGTDGAGSPVELIEPAAVAGVQLTVYGIGLPLAGREEF